MKLFDIRPIHFLIKPLEAEQVAKVLDAYIRAVSESRKKNQII